MGVRGWLTALDADSGKVVWTAYSTGPDTDVLIGPDFKPFYDEGTRQGPRRHDLAAGRRGRSAAAPCGAGSPTIPSSNLIYYGTANPGPWNPEQRPGDNKWTAGSSPAIPTPGEARLVLPDAARTTCSTTTASTRTCCSTCRWQGADRARCSSTPTATATST